MNRIIPILPCSSIKEQVAFYEGLGFRTDAIYTRPNPYAVMSYDTLVIHFYGSKKTSTHENPFICYAAVDHVDHIYEVFTSAYKQMNGHIPRSGIPRISKLKDLKEDRRFTITDIGGNTLYVGTPHAKLDDPVFFRTIASRAHAANFELLYDLLYSKEDYQSAYKMLTKFFPEDIASLEAGPIDLAKILLAALDLHVQKDRSVHEGINGKLSALFSECDPQAADWSKLRQRYHDIVQGE